MGNTSDSAFRIKTIILMVIFITVIYTSYGVFGSITAPSYSDDGIAEYSYNDSTQLDNYTGTDNYEYNPDSGQSFIDVLLGVGEFLTFGNIDNTFARLLINTVNGICFIVLGFMVYLFIRDWVPFV